MWRIRGNSLHCWPAACLLLISFADASLHGQSPDPPVRGPVTFELVAPSEEVAGTYLDDLDIIMSNQGRDSIRFFIGAGYMSFFFVDIDGTILRRLFENRVYPTTGTYTTLPPGRSVSLTEVWRNIWRPRRTGDQDPDPRLRLGPPFEPGTYLLKGIVTLSMTPRGAPLEPVQFETAIHELVIHEAPPVPPSEAGPPRE